MIGNYNSLITHLQLKKMSVMYESAYVQITFQLLEMRPNQAISNIHTRYIFKEFFRKNIGYFTYLHIEKKSIWRFLVNRIV